MAVLRLSPFHMVVRPSRQTNTRKRNDLFEDFSDKRRERLWRGLAKSATGSGFAVFCRDRSCVFAFFQRENRADRTVVCRNTGVENLHAVQFEVFGEENVVNANVRFLRRVAFRSKQLF